MCVCALSSFAVSHWVVFLCRSQTQGYFGCNEYSVDKSCYLCSTLTTTGYVVGTKIAKELYSFILIVHVPADNYTAVPRIGRKAVGNVGILHRMNLHSGDGAPQHDGVVLDAVATTAPSSENW